MSGPTQFMWAGKRVNKRLDRFGAVMSRNTCRTAMSQKVHRHCKGGFMKGSIIADHHVQLQLIAAFFRQRYTDQATAMFGHKVHSLRGYGGSGSDKVALIFPVLIIYYYYQSALTDLLDSLFNWVKHIK